MATVLTGAHAVITLRQRRRALALQTSAARTGRETTRSKRRPGLCSAAEAPSLLWVATAQLLADEHHVQDGPARHIRRSQKPQCHLLDQPPPRPISKRQGAQKAASSQICARCSSKPCGWEWCTRLGAGSAGDEAGDGLLAEARDVRSVDRDEDVIQRNLARAAGFGSTRMTRSGLDWAGLDIYKLAASNFP
jgi:hypothetical protein